MESLEGIRVIDLSFNLPGPFCTQILGDMGAEIIKIETFTGDPTRNYPPYLENESVNFLLLNRNKKSLCLNINTEKGQEIIHRLIKTADILVECYRPITADKLGLSYEQTSKLNPNIIHCSITGYGKKVNDPGHDINYLGQTGILDLTGPKEFPVVPSVQLADIGGGALPAVIAILSAIIARNKTGKGTFIDISMVHQLIPWTTLLAQPFFTGDSLPGREENFLSGFFPLYRIYRTKDSKYITLGILEPKFWRNFCLAVNKEDLLEHQYDLELLEKELPVIFQTRTSDEWEDLFKSNTIPGAKVLTLKEALTKYKETTTTIDHPSIGRIKIFTPSFGDKKNINPPPVLGQHSREVLLDLGYSTEEITELLESEVISVAKDL